MTSRGQCERGAPTSVYLDANAIIGLIEGEAEELGSLLFDNTTKGLLRLYTSEFTLAEVLVTPIREANQRLIATYEEFVSSDESLSVVPIDRATLIRSADIRATIGNKAADAIHVATAVGCGCAVFLSNDARIKLPPGLARLGLNEAINLDQWP